jgi:hypothetical protein
MARRSRAETRETPASREIARRRIIGDGRKRKHNIMGKQKIQQVHFTKSQILHGWADECDSCRTRARYFVYDNETHEVLERLCATHAQPFFARMQKASA